MKQPFRFSLFLFLLLVVYSLNLLGTEKLLTSQTNSSFSDSRLTTDEVIKHGHLINMNFNIGSYKVYLYQTRQVFPPEAGMTAFAVLGDNVKQLRTIKDISEIVTNISNEEEALSFVRFFTSPETHFLFRDTRLNGIETSNEYGNFSAIPESIRKEISFSRPHVEQSKQSGFIVRRLLALYPASSSNSSGPLVGVMPKLVEIREEISREGNYSFEIERVIAEDSWVNDLLKFYR